MVQWSWMGLWTGCACMCQPPSYQSNFRASARLQVHQGRPASWHGLLLNQLPAKGKACSCFFVILHRHWYAPEQACRYCAGVS